MSVDEDAEVAAGVVGFVGKIPATLSMPGTFAFEDVVVVGAEVEGAASVEGADAAGGGGTTDAGTWSGKVFLGRGI